MGREKMNARYLSNQIQKEVDKLYKRCAKCKLVKHIDLFTKNKQNIHGRHSYCKECRAIARKKDHEKNKERDNLYSKNYYYKQKE